VSALPCPKQLLLLLLLIALSLHTVGEPVTVKTLRRNTQKLAACHGKQ
jgi:hypothetical protein